MKLQCTMKILAILPLQEFFAIINQISKWNVKCLFWREFSSLYPLSREKCLGNRLLVNKLEGLSSGKIWGKNQGFH
jgi:hypothetical protein